MEKNHDDQYDILPLYATKSGKARIAFQLFAVSLFVGICFIFVYRVRNIPSEEEAGRWTWIGLFLSELWFCFYWFMTLVVRWNPIYRFTFKDRLSIRYEEALPDIDIFICTADPMIEPPAMVINTVLSVMAYDYPPQKLNVYLSDDGGSDLTFYAMVEASNFSKIWLPFCKKFKVEPRSPEAYFRTTAVLEPLEDPVKAKEWSFIKVFVISGPRDEPPPPQNSRYAISSQNFHHLLGGDNLQGKREREEEEEEEEEER